MVSHSVTHQHERRFRPWLTVTQFFINCSSLFRDIDLRTLKKNTGRPKSPKIYPLESVCGTHVHANNRQSESSRLGSKPWCAKRVSLSSGPQECLSFHLFRCQQQTAGSEMAPLFYCTFCGVGNRSWLFVVCYHRQLF